MNPTEYLHSLFNLTGKVAVVIGGTGELCGAMAEGLAGAGAEVVLVGRSEEKAAARLAKISAAGGKAWFHSAEATSKAELEGLRDAVLKKSGRIDIVINGAGINSATPFFDVTEEEFDRIMRVDFKSVFLGCQVFGKYLVERGQGGSIINLGSMAGLAPISRVFTYSAAKGALHNLSLNLAREWGPHKVRVNVLVPGFFPAEQNRRLLFHPDGSPTPRAASILSHTPMARFGSADELAGAAVFLASPKAASFVTGIDLRVDGGFLSQTI